MGPLGLSIFNHCTKFGEIMLIEAKIMAQNLNPRWRSRIFEYLISEHWDPLRCRFPSHYQIWFKNVYRRRNYGRKSKSKMAAVRHLRFSKIWFLSTGTLWAADFPSLYQIWRKNVDRRQNYGRKSKSKMAAVRHLGRWRPSAILDLLRHHIRRPAKSFYSATSACEFLC